MSRLTGWWSGRSSAAKVELYTRWTFHLFAPLEIAALAGMPLGRAPDSPLDAAGAAALVLLICAHAVLSAVVASRALDRVLDRREHPTRLTGALIALTCGGTLGAFALLRTGLVHDAAIVAGVCVGLVCFTLGTLALCLTAVRHILYAVPATALAFGALGAAGGIGLAPAVGLVVAVLLGGTGLAAACGFSGWLLRIVWELERSRELKARLAVAEERLRFGRDLHDVMGRNLSVIALKSELAVQLSRRGRPAAAADQMTEVQRISRESQRELREVVRGYREADLRAELEGARGVLAAAGIVCTVDADGVAATEHELSADVRSALGWVVREATTNVLRHGDARHCAISLRAARDADAGAEAGGETAGGTVGGTAGAVVLTVENDGVETAAVAVQGAGSGLAGLRERLGAVDGTLDAGPVAPRSFRVTARVPLPARRGTPGARPEAAYADDKVKEESR
ncbi:sensor histidine kinase [Streptomyces sp. NPDC015232]|uniref:sensor histidine kinase n=1 Tax=unclassified Streptomyces TaxID=2593676 RepID=UPI003700E4AF